MPQKYLREETRFSPKIPPKMGVFGIKLPGRKKTFSLGVGFFPKMGGIRHIKDTLRRKNPVPRDNTGLAFLGGVLLFSLWALIAQPIGGVSTPYIWAAESSPSPSSDSECQLQVRQCLQNLNADSYFLRQQARQQLEQMLAEPKRRALAAEEIRRNFSDPALPVEVRHVLESLRTRFPEAFSPGSSPPTPTQKQIHILVQQLESESYAERRGAAEHLKIYLENPESSGLILAALRTRMAQGDVSADFRRWIDPLWDRAWGAWLASSSPSTQLPPARPEEVQRYLDILAHPLPTGSPQALQTLREAQRQLRTLLVRDDQTSMIRQAIQSRLDAGGLPPEVQTRLAELADLCRPAMVAEFWQQRQHRGIQHLLVGVPSQVAGAPRPSHFDFIDDTTAHCVSGSNLTPGYYPVGVAIPHPHQVDAFFHLVNLPTPRRRMAYDYLVQRDVQLRLAEITQRTCQYYLRRRQPLAEREILLLAQLDSQGVSGWAAEFLQTVADEPLDNQEGQTAAGRTSRHGLLCMVLAQQGTRNAVPGLLRAIADGRILPPTPESPYAWPWIAALAIASRDPWPEVDHWLAEVISRTDPLRLPGVSPEAVEHLAEEDPLAPVPPTASPHTPRTKISPSKADSDPSPGSFEQQAPQLGATAAALLLQRHEQIPTSHGLLPTPDLLLEKYKVPGYRFGNPKTPEQILQWWKTRQMLRTSAG